MRGNIAEYFLLKGLRGYAPLLPGMLKRSFGIDDEGEFSMDCLFKNWGYAPLLPCMSKIVFLFGVVGEHSSIFSTQGLKGLCTPSTLHLLFTHSSFFQRYS
jgi:hypothetical protein